MWNSGARKVMNEKLSIIQLPHTIVREIIKVMTHAHTNIDALSRYARPLE